MSHTLIALVSAAGIVGVPLAAHAADDTLPMPHPIPLTAPGQQSGYFMLPVKSGATVRSNESKISPVLYGPDSLSKWNAKAGSEEFARPRLEGERFHFR